MVGLKICDWNGNEVGVTISFAHNETIPKLHFIMDDEGLDEMDAESVFNLIKIAEANTNAIWQFDKEYDWDCMAEFNDDVFIQKYCCDDETDNEYFVDLPKVQECVTECSNCPLCNYSPRKYDCRFHELYPRDE